jgi:hypothetical protein
MSSKTSNRNSEQRIHIKLSVKLGSSARGTRARLSEAYGTDTMKKPTVEWRGLFK